MVLHLVGTVWFKQFCVFYTSICIFENLFLCVCCCVTTFLLKMDDDVLLNEHIRLVHDQHSYDSLRFFLSTSCNQSFEQKVSFCLFFCLRSDYLQQNCLRLFSITYLARSHTYHVCHSTPIKANLLTYFTSMKKKSIHSATETLPLTNQHLLNIV